MSSEHSHTSNAVEIEVETSAENTKTDDGCLETQLAQLKVGLLKEVKDMFASCMQ